MSEVNKWLGELWSIPVNKWLEELLSIQPDTITITVIVICAALFLFSFLFPRLRDISPALMISAGIIGTFWGTFIALSEFPRVVDSIPDVKAMVDSIPHVLDGMKTAFITSLIGLFAAFISKIAFIITPRKAPPPLPVEQDMKALLKEIKDGIIGDADKSLSSQLSILQSEYRDSAKELKQAIAGDTESSIAGQLTKLRNENIQGFKTLDGLSETIKVSLVDNMKALMEQIEDVIVNQLTEQLKRTNDLLHEQLREMLDRIEKELFKTFGEPFKQFNEATQAIKKWQEEHKEHVEQLTAAFRETAQGIGKIRADCESIPDTMQELARLMGELDERLKAFAEMKTQAEQSFSSIKENLDAVGNNLRAAAAGFEGLEGTITQTYKNAQTLAAKHIAAANEHIEKVETEINQAINKVSESTQQMMEKSKSVSTQHTKQMQEITLQVQNSIAQCTEDYTKAVSSVITEITEQLGDNMVGIAEKAAEIIKQGEQR